MLLIVCCIIDYYPWSGRLQDVVAGQHLRGPAPGAITTSTNNDTTTTTTTNNNNNNNNNDDNNNDNNNKTCNNDKHDNV